MKLIIFGPPGSGKGVYSTNLAQQFNLKKISSGDLFREILKQDTPLGKKVKEILEKGKLQDDSLTNEITKKEILSLNGKSGFILDGYPRTVNQAEFLAEITEVDAIILIKAAKVVLVEKTLARRNCKNCGYPWNIANIDKTVEDVHYYLPVFLPKNPEICDNCGKKLELVQRPDDTPEVVEGRLEVYETQTKPLIAYYRKKVPFVEVWMHKPPEFIVAEMVDGLKKLGLIK